MMDEEKEKEGREGQMNAVRDGKKETKGAGRGSIDLRLCDVA